MITGGTATYERRVKTGDYEHANAKVELSFASPEGDYETWFDLASRQAQRKVYEMLGLAGAPDVPATKPEMPSGAAKTATPIVSPTPPAAEPAPKRKAGRPPKAATPIVPVNEPEVRDASFEQILANTPEPGPDEDLIDAPAASGRPMPAAEKQPWEVDDEPAEASTEITDALLTDVITKKHGQLTLAFVKLQKPKGESAKVIRALIAEASGSPTAQAAQIPQAARAKFIEQVNALSAK